MEFDVVLYIASGGCLTYVADAHYAKAIASCDVRSTVGALNNEKAAQNPTQQVAGQSRTNSQETRKARRNRANCVPVLQAAGYCEEQSYPLGESNPCCRTENPEA